MSTLNHVYQDVRNLIKAQGYYELYRIFQEKNISDEIVEHDNWNGGIDFFCIYLNVSSSIYAKIQREDNLTKYEKNIEDAFCAIFRGDESIQIRNVYIRPRNIDTEENDEALDIDTRIYFEVRETNNRYCAEGAWIRQKPERYPCFLLNHNNGWNDYSYYTWFGLIYYESADTFHNIGNVKIMCQNTPKTIDALGKSFNCLTPEFCSLGMSTMYYDSLFRYLGKEYAVKVLNALNDAAVNISIYDRFKEDSIFINSLLRDADSERALREAKFIVFGKKIENAYRFEYDFYPPYNQDISANWLVNFHPNTSFFSRVVGVIGENGIGKTSLLINIIKDLTSEGNGHFKEKPLYSSIIAISTTLYDGYRDITSPLSYMPYKSCCVEQNLDNMQEKMENAIHKIIKRGRFNRKDLWRYYVNNLKKLLDTNYIEDLIYQDDYLNTQLNQEKLAQIISMMSSGQLHLFALITHLHEHVRYDTLFIIDEPEVHLHPYAVMQLINVLNTLLEQFESYAIIATHSPIVVREIIGRNVYLLRKLSDNIPIINSLDIETLGEDISILYQTIFNYDESKSTFRLYIKRLIEDGYNYEDIIKELSRNGIILNINSKFIIRNLIAHSKNHSHEEY